MPGQAVEQVTLRVGQPQGAGEGIYDLRRR